MWILFTWSPLVFSNVGKVLYINNQTSAFKKGSGELGLLLYTVAMPDILIKSKEKDRGWLHKQFV